LDDVFFAPGVLDPCERRALQQPINVDVEAIKTTITQSTGIENPVTPMH
tara:strand:- start:226 stop:372 length:147 start_codon:yes stop_codon:yes gene_type:complete